MATRSISHTKSAPVQFDNRVPTSTIPASPKPANIFAAQLVFAAPVLTALTMVVLITVGGCSNRQTSSVSSGDNGDSANAPDSVTSAKNLAAENLAFVRRVEPQIKAFCGDCHAMPRATSSPEDEWDMEIIQGFDLYRQSGRTDLSVPNEKDVQRYFKLQAPDDAGMPAADTLDYPAAKLPHVRRTVSRTRTRPAGVTNVQWIDLQFPSRPGSALVYCDIGTGAINAYWPGTPDAEIIRLATLLQPVHCEPCDLDQDGRVDLLVSDIGEFHANDSDLGRVIWLQRIDGEEKFRLHVLAEGLSRTADAREGDFDNDGDPDILVAAFGWRNSGNTFLMLNQSLDDNGVPKFESKEIDPRHGPVHVPPVDFDNDGDLDFISLISQEHERVELFRNDGKGNFTSELIFAAPDPAYGSSGIELVDMDGDQDPDILFTNGDSFDRGPKPFHSVQWLENDGKLPMKRHHVGNMPGVLNATAGDFDRDGDMDIIAVALLDRQTSSKWVKQGASPIVMFVNQNDGTFRPTQLQGNLHDHLSVTKGDFNQDGHLDFAIGNFFRLFGNEAQAVLDQPELLIWDSLGKASDGSDSE